MVAMTSRVWIVGWIAAPVHGVASTILRSTGMSAVWLGRGWKWGSCCELCILDRLGVGSESDHSVEARGSI